MVSYINNNVSYYYTAVSRGGPAARPAFEGSNLENLGPVPGGFGLSKGHLEVGTSSGSGIWDPRSEILRIEIMRTDRKSPSPKGGYKEGDPRERSRICISTLTRKKHQPRSTNL